MDAFEYIRSVDKEMAQLRAEKLGQHTLFTEVWPAELSEERQREWLADRLLFALAELSPFWTNKRELDRSWEWLYGMICYLCEHCCETDRKFLSLFHLKKQPQAIRQDIFPLYIDTLRVYRAIRDDLLPPAPLEQLEAAVVRVTGAQR